VESRPPRQLREGKTARSTMSWSIRKLFCGTPSSTPPISRIVLAVFRQ
jgi:hypothetical protein